MIRLGIPLLVTLTACDAEPLAVAMGDADYAVYSDLIRAHAGESPVSIVVGAATVATYPEDEKWLRRTARETLGADRVMVRRFIDLSRSEASLEQDRLLSPAPLILLPDSTAYALLDEPHEAELNQFQAEYPGSGGFLQVSRIGFDQDTTRALVDVIWHCGDLCGNATMYLLARSADGWAIVQRSTHTSM